MFADAVLRDPSGLDALDFCPKQRTGGYPAKSSGLTYLNKTGSEFKNRPNLLAGPTEMSHAHQPHSASDQLASGAQQPQDLNTNAPRSDSRRKQSYLDLNQPSLSPIVQWR